MSERRYQEGHHNKPFGQKPMTLKSPHRPKNSRMLDAHEHVLLSSRRDGKDITVHMMDGSKLIGPVTDFDKFSFAVRSDGKTVVLFKHAVSAFYF